MDELTTAYARNNCHQIAGFLRYLAWLATDAAADGHEVSAAQLWEFYQQHLLVEGRFPIEVAEDMGLPIFPEW